MVGILFALAVALVFFLAAWRMTSRWDPPYRGLHEEAGRHRRPDWSGP